MPGFFKQSRRSFVLVLAATLACGPDRAFAQKRRVWKVGFLMPNSTDPHLWSALKDELAKLGYLEARDIGFVEASVDGNFARFPALAEELVGARVDLIVAAATPAVRAAKNATTTIPIVIATAGDPVASGLVASFARPGGNITGMSNRASDVSIKMFELARSTLPRMTRVATLRNPANPAWSGSTRLSEAAAKTGVLRRVCTVLIRTEVTCVSWCAARVNLLSPTATTGITDK